MDIHIILEVGVDNQVDSMLMMNHYRVKEQDVIKEILKCVLGSIIKVNIDVFPLPWLDVHIMEIPKKIETSKEMLDKLVWNQLLLEIICSIQN